MIGYPQDGTLTLNAIKKTKGQCLIAPDKVAIALGRTLAETEGIFVEPTSATGIYAVGELKTAGIIRGSDTVVVVLTGHGLKTSDAYTGFSKEPPVADSPEVLRSIIESDG